MSKVTQLIQYILPSGIFIDLHSPPTRAIRNMSGWGYPPLNVHEISGPYQHGTTVLGYRYQPRTVAMDLLFSGGSRNEWFGERTKLIERIGLQNTNPNYPVLGHLRWEYIEDGEMKQRDLNCYLSRGLRYENTPNWFQWGLVEPLEFTANDPIIYDPNLVTVTIDTFTDHLILPMTFPFLLGAGEGNVDINYTGSWLTYPIIEIDGPTNGIMIENESTEVSITLDYFISAGITVTINLTPDFRTVVDNLGNNLIDYVRNSNLAEFSIQIDPNAAGGVNSIAAYVAEYDANTEIRIKYYTRYVGI